MRITDLLDKRSINLNAAPKTKSEALDMAVELMAKSGKIDDIESYRGKDGEQGSLAKFVEAEIKQHVIRLLKAEKHEAFESGTRYSVWCLDGGAWDRPTSYGHYADFEEALATAVGLKR